MTSTFNHQARTDFLVANARSILCEFVLRELPGINSAIEAKTAHPDSLVIRIRPLLAGVAQEVDDRRHHLDRHTARKLLQIVGFAVSSVERHSQASGEEPGAGKALLGPLDELLLKLGRIGQHPPRDSDTTYFYLNTGGVFKFTGDPQEAHFNRVVNVQRTVQSAACNLLRPICSGSVPVSSPDAIHAVIQAAGHLESLVEAYRTFTEIGPDGGYRFSPDFFMRRMRTYLVGYPVAGEVWAGPNAANLAANMSLDYLAGVTAPFYTDIVEKRWRYLVTEDQAELHSDMHSASLTDRVVQAMELNCGFVMDSLPEDLARYISGRPAEIQQMLCGFYQLMSPLTQATGIHYRLIKDYLIKNAEKLTPQEQQALPVKPTQGTGNMGHDQTRQIMEMRRKHPVVSKLLGAIRVANLEVNQLCATERQKEIH
jgi:hypothetical protein